MQSALKFLNSNRFHMIYIFVVDEEDYHTMTYERACELLGQTAVTQEEFQRIKADVKEMFN